MVVFPEQFIQLNRYPGYYWNIETKTLFSCKSGELKQLTIKRGFRNHPPGYGISVNGRKVLLPLHYLNMINSPINNQTFPIKRM